MSPKPFLSHYPFFNPQLYLSPDAIPSLTHLATYTGTVIGSDPGPLGVLALASSSGRKCLFLQTSVWKRKRERRGRGRKRGRRRRRFKVLNLVSKLYNLASSCFLNLIPHLSPMQALWPSRVLSVECERLYEGSCFAAFKGSPFHLLWILFLCLQGLFSFC